MRGVWGRTRRCTRGLLEAVNLHYVAEEICDPARAERSYRQALTICEQELLGPDHPEVAKSLRDLGECLREEGKYAEAEPLFRRALAITEKSLEPDHLETALSLNFQGTAVIISVPFLENLLPKAVEHFHYARQCSIIQARTISLRAIATLALGRPRRPQR